jgi:transposase-like protein
MTMRLRVDRNLKVWPKPPGAPETSLDLLRFALEGGDSSRELSRRLGLNPNALNLARHRGRLSPTAAGALAAHVGLDPTYWTAIAAMEAEPDSAQKTSLLQRLKAAALDIQNS